MIDFTEYVRLTNRPARILTHMSYEAILTLREKWDDEAADFALAGHPQYAQFIQEFPV